MAVRRSAMARRGNKNLFGFVILGFSMVVGSWVLSRANTPGEREKESKVIVGEYDTVLLPVPSKPVTSGTRVKNIPFTLVSFPSHQIPKGAITDIKVIEDSVAVASLPGKLPMFPENFSSTYAVSNPVIEKIPPGMRAMTIRVDATTAVEGWAGSGALVDILLIAKDQTTVVAERVKILSAERSVSPVEGGSAPNVPSTVTLLVTQEQCLAINTAVPLGKIAFALRSASDDEAWSEHLYTAEQLRNDPSSTTEKVISGYIKVHGDERQYALSDGRWISTDVVPHGFLIGDKHQ